MSDRKLVYDMDSWLSEQLIDKWRALRLLRLPLMGIEGRAVRRATVVLPVCEDLAQKIRPWTDESRVIVLPDVPADHAEPEAHVDSLHALVPQDSVVGLYVGNLETYQGIDLLLEGMARLPQDTRFRLIVIGGSDSDIERYRRRGTQLAVNEIVSFIGPRPLAQLNAYLEQADVLVSPRTLGGNTPMKIYSYMQSGKAIVATDIRSHTQVLDDSCAELVAPEPESFAGGISRLVEDVERRNSLGAAAQQKAQSEYSLAAYRSRLKRAYELVAAG